ncbi:MAG: hypothetical protein FWD40_07725 [Treponema sp.]|nr:hypothetical protein [Treponema sp.]
MKKLFILVIFAGLFLLINCRAQKNQEIQITSQAWETSLQEAEHAQTEGHINEEPAIYYEDYEDFNEDFRNMHVNYGAENILLPLIVDLFQFDEEHEHFISLNYWFSSRNNFRLWGWSRDGKAAYSYADIWDGPGWISTEVYILDLIDNSILWKNSVVDNGEGRRMIYSEGSGYDEEGPAIDYEAFFQGFRNICINNGIEFIQTEFRKLPVIHNNIVYNVIEEINKKEDSHYGYEEIESYRIIVETQGKRKVINEDGFSETEFIQNTIFNVFSLGYFISPFENRALIVIGRHIPHYEATNNDFLLVSCHLDTDFMSN